MQNARTIVSRWGPPILWMAVIFASSATPSSRLPSFGWLDTVVKKGGHMLGYAVLAILYRRALGWDTAPAWQAWLLAVLYAMADEFHQSFVPGRHPAWLDVFLFDGGGAALALWASAAWHRPRA